MNMMAFEFDDDIIIVDCGVMFPDAELLGVDIVIPDLSYVRENRERIRAILLTHGHEDHIGGLPYLLEEVDVPVYGTAFTLALAHSKLVEHDLAESTDLREMHPRDAVPGGAVPRGVHPPDAQHHSVRRAGHHHAAGHGDSHRRFQT